MHQGVELRYEMATHTLENGLRVCVQPDPLAPAVAVNLWYEVGSYDELPGKSGFAHLFEHLMFQGSADVASGEHMATIESVGGSVNATTSTDRTNYFETVPTGALELALWLEANRMSSLAITQENFEAQVEVVKEEKRQRYDNQPYGDLYELLIAQHYEPSHPYGHLPIGSMTDLDAASLADVQQFFDSWYRPSNARLVLAGNVAAETAIELVERYFAQVPAQPRPSHQSPLAGAAGGGTTTVTRKVPHSLLYASWPTPPADHDDNLVLDVALAILTDGHTSRLHKRLVRQLGLAQEVHGSALLHLRDSSVSTILARPADGVSTASTAAALHEALQDFAADGPTPEELERAVAQYERSWLQDLATVEGRADMINDSWLTFGEPERLNSRLAELTAITPDDVRRVVATRLSGQPAELHYLADKGDR
ncbi:insulinase family protein [Tessaracoccus sp. OS52]|uniref:M16 family metallopeptidase n=1 Tax=Tessaracoccus sp. OS52 TaxID=2886691 RepID=UPI001D0F6EA6|nr:pitrilysin family protein [Tessaracoccus sp. OS52]MCC2593099.1 insulinase family protein [Tessaracoccus sp. OS52]